MRLLLLLALCPLAFPADRFPKPGPEAFLSELKLMTDGSVIRAPREDWAGAQRRLAKPEWDVWLRSQRTTVDDWIAHRRDRVEWIAGWWHDFVNATDGGFLEWTPDPPAGLTAKQFGGWVFGFRTRHIEHLVNAAYLYRLTGERKYADWVVSQLNFYADNFEKWPLRNERRGNLSRLMYQGLDEANILVRFLHAARVLGDAATPELRKQWHANLFRKQSDIIDQTMQRIHNIACWQRSAMAQAALFADDEELWTKAVDGPFGIRRQVAEGVTSDYFWLEQSLGYNAYVVAALRPFFEAAGLAGRLDSLKREAAIIENLMLAPIGIRFPNGLLPNPADATGRGRAPDPGLLASTYRVFPTTLGLAAAARQKSWATLLDPPEAPSEGPPLPEVRSANLASSRFALLKQGPWQVFFHYGQLDASHAQAEALHFEAFYGSTDITHDPGTVGYGSPLHRGFYQTPWAHNVPVIDGEGQQGWNEGELVSFSDTKVTARQPVYRKDARCERTLSLEGGKLVDTVTIEAGPAERRLGLLLQLQGEVILPETAAIEGGPPYWTGLSQRDAGREIAFTALYAGKPMRITVRASGPLRIRKGSAPDAPPHRRAALLMETTGVRAEFATTFEPLTAQTPTW